MWFPPVVKHLLTNVLIDILSKALTVSFNEDIFETLDLVRWSDTQVLVLEFFVIVGKLMHLS